jgi:hypothetical protein
VGPLKGHLFGAETRLESGLAKFSHPLDQCLQVRCQLRFLPLIINMRRKEVFVRPLGFSVYINEEPLSGGSFLVALERGIQVFISVMTMQ